MGLTDQHKKELLLQASAVREKTVELIYKGNGGHIGGDLSEVDILVATFDYMKHDPKNPEWEGRDYFILSKGHSAEAYYLVLHQHGYIENKDLEAFGSFGAKLGGHPCKKIRGVEANTGSLGHGLGLAAGMALALKRDGKENRVFVLTGDGELAEGSNWEAAMSAGKFQLENLTWIIDRNHLQISGDTEEVMPLEKLKEKTEAFGFYTMEINGHDMDAIMAGLETKKEKPICIIANTIKGKGMPCAENQASWHHKTPSKEQVEEMKQEMERYRKELS
ncbi:transketolase [Suipraeoptans intestinalis]|uniref:transketolase n=1 Tax=Suipraeoptans intestinalis TaxID=2606628 RepID=UPI002A7508EE|nr:transketolase [Suipraeoptans intestinalis]MDY3121972.1 transketolase [Suipraeoptans intestinalis]